MSKSEATPVSEDHKTTHRIDGGSYDALSMDALRTSDQPLHPQWHVYRDTEAPSSQAHVMTHALWTDASHWRGGHTWAWVDHADNFAHGRGMGFAIDNNEAELWANAEALRTIPVGDVVHVNTDSVAAAALMPPFADVDDLPVKPMRNATTLYRECLAEIDFVSADKSVVVHWLKGHRSSGRNVAADRLATAARWEDTTLDEWLLDCEHALAAITALPGLECSCCLGTANIR